MGTVVLDASVVIGLLDPSDALHVSATRVARDRRRVGATFVLPASVLAEALVGAARSGEAELGVVRGLIADAFGEPYPVDEAVAVATATRRAAHPSLRLPDALVLATADVLRAEAVLTGDKRWRGFDRRVEVVGS